MSSGKKIRITKKEEEITALKQNVEELQQKVKNVKRVEDIMKEITKLKAQDKTTANGATITESIANREAAGKRLTKIAKMVKKLDANSEVRRWLDDVVCMDRAGHNCTSNHVSSDFNVVSSIFSKLLQRGPQGSHLLDLALEDLSRFKNNSKAVSFQFHFKLSVYNQTISAIPIRENTFQQSEWIICGQYT